MSFVGGSRGRDGFSGSEVAGPSGFVVSCPPAVAVPVNVRAGGARARGDQVLLS